MTLSKNIGGVSVGAELSYRQNMPLLCDPVQALPTPLVNAAAGQISINNIPTERHARRARRHVPRSRQRRCGSPKTPFFDTASFAGRAHLDALGQGHAERGGVQGPRQLHRRSTSRRATSSASRSTSRRRGSRCCRASTCSRRSRTRAASTATPRCSSGGNEDAGNYAVGLAADIYSKYRVDLKYTGYFGDYSTNPATGARATRRSTACSARCRTAAGWSLTFKTTF